MTIWILNRLKLVVQLIHFHKFVIKLNVAWVQYPNRSKVIVFEKRPVVVIDPFSDQVMPDVVCNPIKLHQKVPVIIGRHYHNRHTVDFWFRFSEKQPLTLFTGHHWRRLNYIGRVLSAAPGIGCALIGKVKEGLSGREQCISNNFDFIRMDSAVHINNNPASTIIHLLYIIYSYARGKLILYLPCSVQWIL